MIGGFSIGAAAVASQPQYAANVPGVVWGGDYTLDRVYGGDSGVPSTGYAYGGDSPVGVVYGGDERAG